MAESKEHHSAENAGACSSNYALQGIAGRDWIKPPKGKVAKHRSTLPDDSLDSLSVSFKRNRTRWGEAPGVLGRLFAKRYAKFEQFLEYLIRGKTVHVGSNFYCTKMLSEISLFDRDGEEVGAFEYTHDNFFSFLSAAGRVYCLPGNITRAEEIEARFLEKPVPQLELPNKHPGIEEFVSKPVNAEETSSFHPLIWEDTYRTLQKGYILLFYQVMVFSGRDLVFEFRGKVYTLHVEGYKGEFDLPTLKSTVRDRESEEILYVFELKMECDQAHYEQVSRELLQWLQRPTGLGVF